MLDDRKLVVGIGPGVTVPGEVLGARRNAVALEGLDDDPTEPPDLVRVRRQRPVADDRVGRLVVHVEHRGEIERHSNRRQLVRQRGGEPFSQPRVTAAPEPSHRRPLGEGRAQPRDAPPFLVDAHPQRHVARKFLSLECELGQLLRGLDVSTEQHDTAEIPLPRQRAQLRRHGVPTESDHHQLSDVTMQRFHV